MRKITVTLERLRELLVYDPETGVFTWLARADNSCGWNTKYAGREAGNIWPAGRNLQYRCISIDGRPYYAHRLAWFYGTGKWPAVDADHWDGDGLNNRWTNLRDATKTQNAANSARPITNSTGFKGVSVRIWAQRPRYRATIRIDGRQKNLGTFDTAEAAHAAYCAAAKMAHGEFARAA